MKQILFIVMALLMCSCSQDYLEDIPEKSYKINPQYTYEEVFNMTKEVLDLCSITEDLIAPPSIDMSNLDSMLNAVFFMEKQPVFGDTVEEAWCYEIWHKMLIRQHNCIFDEEDCSRNN